MIHIENSAFFKCLIDLPDDFLSKKSYPLVVGLHGGGHNPDNLISLWKDIPDRNFIYSVPQAPYPMVANAELRFDWAMWPSENEELINRATELSEKYIMNVVHEMQKNYNIDEVYLMGWSQGAIFSYLVGLKQHSHFNGIICLSGPGLLAPLKNPFAGSSDSDWLTEEAIQRAKSLRVFITHGNEDKAANYELGIRSRDILMNHEYDVTFRDFTGGHSYPPRTILEEIVNWVKEPNTRSES